MCFVGLKGPLPNVDIWFDTYNEMNDYLNEKFLRYKDNTKLNFYVLETDTMYIINITNNDYE